MGLGRTHRDENGRQQWHNPSWRGAVKVEPALEQLRSSWSMIRKARLDPSVCALSPGGKQGSTKPCVRFFHRAFLASTPGEERCPTP